MRISKPILIVAIVILAIVAIGSIFAYETANWMLGRARRSPVARVNPTLLLPTNSLPQISNATTTDATTDNHAWDPVQVGAVMSDAFDKGKLPGPLAVAASNPDAAAAELAQKVALRDEHSTSALLSAIKLAGFSVRGTDGNILLGKANSGQGIVFDAWEAASAAKLYGDELHTSLANFSDAFTQSIPGFKSVPFTKLLIAGIRSDTESKKPELRFWARFIVELGKRADSAYDLLSPNLDPQNAQLDAVQFAFITSRLAADLAIVGNKQAPRAKSKSLQRSGNFSCSGNLKNADFRQSYRSSSYQAPLLSDAVWRRGESHYAPAAFQEGEGGTGSSQLPCNLTEGQMQLLDVVAYSYGIGFDRLMELLEEPGILTEGGISAIESLSNFTLLGNAVLTYLKLIFISTHLKATITMDSPPLVRSLDPVPGCRRKLHAQIMQEVGNWQIINCLRTALNTAGLDVSLPSDGPLKEVPSQWHLVEGGVNVAEAAAAGMNTAIVEFVCNGPRIQHAGTYAGVSGAADGVPVTDCTQPVTSEDGKVDVDLEGFPRKSFLEGQAVPVMKTAKVQLTFAAKASNMKQDLIDTMAAGGLIGGNPIVLLTVVPVEMILRSRWFASPVFTVPVKDWVHCNGGWGGNITYSRTLNTSNNDGSMESEFRDRQKWRFTGERGADGTSAADWDASFTSHEVMVGKPVPLPLPPECELIKSTDEVNTEGHNEGTTHFKVLIYAGKYVIFLEPLQEDTVDHPATVTGTLRTYVVYTCNVYDHTESYPDGQLDAVTVQINGTLDPKDPNHLSGTRSETLGDGSTVQFGWDLQPCGMVGDVCTSGISK